MCLETLSVSGTRFGLSVQHDAWGKMLISTLTIGIDTSGRPSEVDILGGGRGGGAFLPVEHNPLGTGGNAVVTLIQGRETCQDCIIIVGHVVDRFCITVCCDTRSVGFRICKAMPRMQIQELGLTTQVMFSFLKYALQNWLRPEFCWVDGLF